MKTINVSTAQQPRQGEVLLCRISGLPASAVAQPTHILRAGSQQGFDHVLQTPNGQPLTNAIYTDNGVTYVYILDTAQLVNVNAQGAFGKHHTLTGLHGTYRVVIHTMSDPYLGVRESRD